MFLFLLVIYSLFFGFLPTYVFLKDAYLRRGQSTVTRYLLFIHCIYKIDCIWYIFHLFNWIYCRKYHVFFDSKSKSTKFISWTSWSKCSRSCFLYFCSRYSYFIRYKSILYIFVQGLTPILVKPNQPVTADYRTDRVRIVTDPSGRVVAQTPSIG